MSEALKFDVLGLGCVAVDDLIYVESYPQADYKVRIERQERQCGGLTATALVAASRLGVRCAYAGVLGEDPLSEFALGRLRAEKIDLTQMTFQSQARPVHSTIIVASSDHSRTIFYDLAGAVGAHPDKPAPEVIRASKVLIIDRFGMEGMIRAAKIAREAKIPVIADLENDKTPRFAELYALADHIIVPREFAVRFTGESDPPACALALAKEGTSAAVVTCGRKGCWYFSRSELGEPKHQPAFAVNAKDTTGCGDVFHGAYAAALARGMKLADRVRFASAAAGLKATKPGGQLGIPTLEQVERFLRPIE
jgi:sugar/nucleoside kinase (ribokinase family)